MKVKKIEKEKVIVRHQQSIKQSVAYQSGEVSYGVELPCENTDKSIKETMDRAAALVEAGIAARLKDQQDFLHELGKANR